jgi:hypothetical protein
MSQCAKRTVGLIFIQPCQRSGATLNSTSDPESMRRCFAVFLFQLALVAATSAQEPTGLSIQGHVYADDTGAPSRETRVTLTDVSMFSRKVGVTTTDELGAFMFAGLAPGHYTLSIEKTDFLAEYVPDAAPAKDIAIRLRRASVISGRVTDIDGEIIAMALVEVMKKSYMYGEASLHSVGFAWTDDRGVYRVSGLAPGRYYIRSSCNAYDTVLYPSTVGLASAQTIDTTESTEKDEIDFRMRRGPRFTLQGRLVDSETQGPAQARFLRAESADLVAGTFVDGDVRQGEFQLRGLRPGRYLLTFTWVGATNNVTRTVVFPFEMGNTDETGVVLRAMAVSVTGRIKSVGQKLPAPLSVYLEPTAAVIRAHITGSAADANVAPDGTFSMARVLPGEYYIRIRSGEPARFFAADRDLFVDGRAPITGIELELDLTAGSVSGRTIDAAGRPLARATVVLQSAHPENLAADLYRHIYEADATGQYFITGVLPGEYLLFAWRGDPGLVGDPDLFALARENARRITVKSGGAISQDATELRNP